MAHRKGDDGWTLVPSTQEEIETLRQRCRRIVMRRAAISASVSALPIPGLDIATDLSLLTRSIEDINREFGLTPGQIDRLRPQLRLVAYETVIGMSGVLAGKLVTRELVVQLLRRSGVKMLSKYAVRIVPLAGQVVSSAIGFAAFRTIGNQHIDACVQIAGELVVVQEASASRQK
ncbi:MAG TPA: hypothetical protein DIT28_12735 [Oxalobacteraceae bacterium]|nr:hypothetical protein [Oxalobacteraceae bacterium]